MEPLKTFEAIAFYSKETPEKICLVDANNHKAITYKEFWQTVRGFANRLKLLGLKKGDRVTVRVGGIIETAAAQFGICLAGGVYCPVERGMKDLRMLEMLEYLESDFLMSTEKVPFKGKYINLLSVYDDLQYDEYKDFDLPNPEDLCAIFFTTGTTGKAKGVMLGHKAASIYGRVIIDILDVAGDDVFLWTKPLDKVNALWLPACVFALGGTTVHYNGVVFANDYYDVLDRYNISIINISPYELIVLTGKDKERFSKYADRLKAVFLPGSLISVKHQNQIRSQLPKSKLISLYGSTETIGISCYDFNLYPDKENCIGKPIGTAEVNILDEKRNVMRDSGKDNPGIISCKNDYTMDGYWKSPELTQTVLVDGYMIMTDMGYTDSEGFLYILGRRDDVIVTGGHKVAPYEIENIAMEIPGVLECACVSAKNNVLGEIAKLFLVMKEDYEFSPKEATEFMSRRLETFKLPRIIRQINSLPRLDSGTKIDRKALRDYE